jgi:hypothetical protein
MFKGFFFDYIYYRLYKINVNKGEYQGVPAIIAVSLIQALLIGGVLIWIARIFFDRFETAPYSKLIANLGVVFYVILMVYNFSKFNNKYPQCEAEWGNEPNATKRLKGWLVALVIIFSTAQMMTLGFLK